MGIFDFVSSAGARLFGPSEETKQAAAETASRQDYAEMMAERQAKAEAALRAAIAAHGFPTDGLTIGFDVPNGRVTLGGRVQTEEEREKLVLVVGNVEGVAQVDEQLEVLNPAPPSVFHTVVKGDTLSKLAKTHYGDPMKYPVLFAANQPMLKDPDLIYPGQVLRIPPL